MNSDEGKTSSVIAASLSAPVVIMGGPDRPGHDG